jgi:recombination protein RecR
MTSDALGGGPPGEPGPAGGSGGAGGEFHAPALEDLVRALQQLPGLGRKSATRIALHLLDDREHAGRLTAAVQHALAAVGHCSRCGVITEDDPCHICTSAGREARLLCVVSSPVDVLPFEKAAFFRGRYFVLGGLLSPLDGVGADDLPFDRLLARVEADGVQEVILALDTSVEGETTALYLQRLLGARGLSLTRLATGIPVGGALAYTDEATLQRAFQHRTRL